MTTYRLILALTLCLSSLNLHGEVYKYAKGLNTFEISETSKEYKVICFRSSGGISSRNKNITDRKLRMDAIDLIGSYILFKDSDIAKRLGGAYFQIYVEGLNLHYKAILDGVRQSDVTTNGVSAICYCCDKNAYKITCASYNPNLDIASLLAVHYQNDKSEESAFLLYNYEGFTADQYVALERDFLVGSVQLPSAIRQLQGTIDRYELSIISPDESNMALKYKEAKKVLTQKNPFRQFYYTELVTAAPLKDKKSEYEKWKKLLDTNVCIYESILAFCSNKCCQPVPSESEATLTSVIEAFPGAISPFGIRRPSNNASYNAAAQAYTKSDFTEAVRILKDAINIEGITPEMLNLLGASYRFLNQPDKAIPYLLLCFKIEPQTKYLSGNLFLCLKLLCYSRLEELKTFLDKLAVDSWSKNEINETDRIHRE